MRLRASRSSSSRVRAPASRYPRSQRFGVKSYPFGGTGLLDLECLPRASIAEQPTVRITTNMPIRVVLRWGKSATTVGGVKPDRSRVPPKPLHEKVVTFETAGTTEVAS